MRGVASSLVALWLGMAVASGGEIQPDFLMDAELDVSIPKPIQGLSKSTTALWIEALSRPEADLQRVAAETIAQGHRSGFPELSAAASRLVAIVAAETSHPEARFAAARALIVLDAKDAADALFEASQKNGADLKQLIEPALADWRFVPIRKVWQARLEAHNVRHRDLLLAIRGAETVEDAAAVGSLLKIVHDRLRPATVRLAAARAAGRIRNSGLEAESERLQPLPSANRLNRLCAVALLEQHSSDAALEILLRLAVDPEPSVATAALTRLNAVNVDLVVPLAEQAMQNEDANVREQGVHAWVARPTRERVSLLARLLDDQHPRIRANVRDELFRLAATAELDGPIRQKTMGVLAADGWRGQEQAALLLGALDHEPAADRLVELLESTRSEVTVATAWGLRKIAVPETLPQILDKATRQTDLRKPGGGDRDFDRHVAHLCEAMGLMNYAPAEDLLRQYIPKNYNMGEFSRGAAIWALGKLHAGVPDEPLAALLAARITDPAPPPDQPPEMMRVRLMGTVSIVRMGVTSQLERLRAYMGPKVMGIPSHLAIRWAIRELTGEILPGPDPDIVAPGGRFLESLDDRSLNLPDE
ncbi:MAG: phycocyanin alpha phycocyanobilin lyase [Planctomycetaceae bacterium]|nr:phycocyanin alpha phycocyanobilin lyase [Planctomycetaceae bacterium]